MTSDLVTCSLLLLGLFCNMFLLSILSMAYAGYLHLVRTSLGCSYSILSCSGVEQGALALCVSVLMTLFDSYVVMTFSL